MYTIKILYCILLRYRNILITTLESISIISWRMKKKKLELNDIIFLAVVIVPFVILILFAR